MIEKEVIELELQRGLFDGQHSADLIER
jgi:hypothetical protein